MWVVRHEAGHAVAAYGLGFSVDLVRVDLIHYDCETKSDAANVNPLRDDPARCKAAATVLTVPHPVS